jgi:hypothetical protein
MLKIKFINTQDIKNLLYSVSRFPYFGAIASLLNAFLDMRDIYHGFLDIHIYKNTVKIKTAIYRLIVNLLLGLVGFFPFFIIFAWMIVNPFIIPLISFTLVSANLFKTYTTFKTIKYELSIDQTVLKNKPNENALTILKNTEENLYIAQREFVINALLTIGSCLSAASIFFPPLLMVGIGIGVIGSLLGMLDKKFCFGKKIFKACLTTESVQKKDELIHGSQRAILKKIYCPSEKHKNISIFEKPFLEENKFVYDIFKKEPPTHNSDWQPASSSKYQSYF